VDVGRRRAAIQDDQWWKQEHRKVACASAVATAKWPHSKKKSKLDKMDNAHIL
jgi:hypothetical protein